MDTRFGYGAALAVGGGVMYWLDTRSGPRRRAYARDKLAHAARETGRAAVIALRDLQHRGMGLFATLRSRKNRRAVDDDVLRERIRAKLGRVCSHPGAIEIAACLGEVELNGNVLSHEKRRVLSGVRSVPGVETVHDALVTHDTSEHISALQGGTERTPRFELAQKNWSPGTRLIVGTGAVAAVAVGLRSRSPAGLGASALALSVLARSITNLDFRRLFGVGAGTRAVDVQKTIEVNAPLEEVFALWIAPENFSRFTSHAREVKPNQLVAWKSDVGAVRHAGTARFERNPEGGARVTIRMSYNPPAGALGHAIAKLFGFDLGHEVRTDLARLKTLVEQRAPLDGGL
ncbi:MAG: hypothetical protein ABIP39_03900 [Polyangiaceae bacterium]